MTKYYIIDYIFINILNFHFRCLLPHENLENATYFLSPHIMNASYPLDYDQQELLQCYRLDIFNIFNETMINRHVNTDNSFNQKSFISNTVNIQELKPCEVYVYDRSKYKSTTTSEVNIYI